MGLQTKGHKAMILAAGLGSRLRPLTDRKPKALLEWQGATLLDHVVLKLKDQGFREIIINVHHYAGMIMDHVKSRKSYGIRIEFSLEEEALLDTGGAIAKASWFFDERPFLVHNVDILSNIDLEKLFAFHLESGALATLAVKDRATSRSLLMDREGLLKGWRDNRTGETILAEGAGEKLLPLAFSAIHVAGPEIFELFPEQERFPIIPFYLGMAGTRPVRLYRHDADQWTDMGKLESYT